MKKSITALALALTLVGTLAACSTDKKANSNHNGSAGNQSGVTSEPNSTAGSGTNGTAGSGTSGTASGSAGQVSRRYGAGSTSQGYDYFDDGRYTAGSNGQVYDSNGSSLSQDLTRGARDIVRGTEDVADDIGRGIGNAARDVTGTGNNTYNGTPSWEPDSSAVRQ